ncbi:GntR family transcriptional regulator [Alteromonas sp. KUL49]|uniref:GntR family transcriptional regulator n=1 Tax=Alteromonas sp. KUL49 TaxID=2480798 RepID=UPI0010FFB953|nr:GntR family transcriptional regulator [Alteromonas sp. KUL49]GEA11392.1 hypothetical protein KUL49_17670 [Alteromonas sp. KUL49]
MLQIMVDIDSDVPLFTQLTDQIKSAIASDTLLPGAKLPSIRQLANDLDLNNKTVAKAYRLLERDAVIQSKGYRGTFVHPDAKQNCGQDINDWISAEVQKLVGVLREGGATDSEIRIAFTNAMNK